MPSTYSNRLARLALATSIAMTGCNEQSSSDPPDATAPGREPALGSDGEVGGGGYDPNRDAEQTTDAESVILPSGEITYYQHLKPIIDAKCVRCHMAGTIAPFTLDSYERAKTFAGPARDAVNSGSMPPWLFADGCNEYRGDFSLSALEKQLFNAWVDQGAPEGDRDHPAPPLNLDNLSLSRQDVVLTVPEPFTPQTTPSKPDEYRCFPVRWPEQYKTIKYMTGFRALPGDPKIVHHVEVYRVKPAQAQAALDKDAADPGLGYECFAGPGIGEGTVGGWAPGTEGYDYPEGVGIPVDPGSVFIIQVHYNTSATGPAPDQSAVAFKVDDEAIAGGYNFWTNPLWSVLRTMNVPAGNADVPIDWTSDPTSLGGGKAIQIHMAALHMHNLGKSGYMYLRRKNGERICMFRIDQWDFHWQSGVRLRTPIQVQPGDRIEMQCRFDNSAANQPLVNGVRQAPRAVNWGENTSDEMCLGVLLWSPL